jgi:hypothetical protein
MTCTIPEQQATFYEFDWGYDRGKEFIAGTLFQKDPGDSNGALSGREVAFTFDGEIMRVYRAQPSSKQGRPITVRRGRVAPLDPETFRSLTTPMTLLGRDARYVGRQTLGEALAQTESVSVRSDLESIGGRPCFVLEATGIERLPDGRAFDVLVWIDAERDYRPLRFEKYYSYEGEQRWKALLLRVDDVTLERVDGMWFPVSGRSQFFNNDLEPPPGGPSEPPRSAREALERGVIVVRALTPASVLTIDPASIRINKGIAAERFAFQFPAGTLVLDEVAHVSYEVGGSVRPSQYDPPGAQGEQEVRTLPTEARDTTSRNAAPSDSSDEPGGPTRVPPGIGVAPVYRLYVWYGAAVAAFLGVVLSVWWYLGASARRSRHRSVSSGRAPDEASL